MFFNDFWSRVDTLRGCTLTDLCETIGLNAGTMMVTRSKNKLPNLTDAYKIAQYLGCTIDYLLTGNKGDSLNPTEKELIENYRNCDRFMKIAIESTARDGSVNNREKNTRTAEKPV